MRSEHPGPDPSSVGLDRVSRWLRPSCIRIDSVRGCGTRGTSRVWVDSGSIAAITGSIDHAVETLRSDLMPAEAAREPPVETVRLRLKARGRSNSRRSYRPLFSRLERLV